MVGADSGGTGSGDVELLVDDGADCKDAGAALFGAKVVLSIESLVTGTLCGAIFATSNPLPFELEAWTSGEIILSSTVACFEAGCGCRHVLDSISMPSKHTVFPFMLHFWLHFVVTYTSTSCIRFTVSSSSLSSTSGCTIVCTNVEDPTLTMASISELAQ